MVEISKKYNAYVNNKKDKIQLILFYEFYTNHNVTIFNKKKKKKIG